MPGAEFSIGVTASLIRINDPANVPLYPSASAVVYTSLTTTTPGTLVKYSPLTGAITTNITLPLPPIAINTYYMNGYVLGVQTVNTTGGPGLPGTPTAGQYRLINWTTFGTSTNFTTRVMSNITWPRADISGIGAFGMGASTFFDQATDITFIAREANFFDLVNMGSPYVSEQNNLNPLLYVPATGADNASGVRLGTRIIAISLTTGQILWDKTLLDYSDPAGCTMFAGTCDCPDHGKFAVLMRDGTYNVFDQRNGNLLFKTQKMDSPWDATSFGVYSQASAYGLLFRGGYGAYYAFNWTNGDLVWKFSCPARNLFEEPYTDNGITVYPSYSGGLVADDKVYIVNNEHTPSQPLTRGWSVWCLNAHTGQEIWNISTSGSYSAIADGYLSVSAFDGYQYIFGKGKTAATVTASPKTIANGAQVLIEGTVLDQSPAQSGTPCVSKDSMRTQMEYLHKQQPIDGLYHNETITGVPVTLTAIGSKGTVVDIGSVTTNGYYGTFSKAWTPPNEDTYTITASFAADDSYGSSSAATAVTVGPAPATPETPATPVIPDYTMTIIGAAIAVIIAVAIVGALILMKRK